MKKIALSLVAAVALVAAVGGCSDKPKTTAGSGNTSLVTPPAPAPMPTTATPVTPVTADPAMIPPAADFGGSAPAPGKSYKVVKGDTLFNIAGRAYGGTRVNDKVAKIKAANPSIKGDTISIGQTLTIPQ